MKHRATLRRLKCTPTVDADNLGVCTDLRWQYFCSKNVWVCISSLATPGG